MTENLQYVILILECEQRWVSFGLYLFHFIFGICGTICAFLVILIRYTVQHPFALGVWMVNFFPLFP